MLPLLAFLLSASGAEQDDPARPLVEKLRSDAVQERVEAARRLKALGRAAAPELEKAAADPDGEVAARARLLLRTIAVLERLTPRLREALPGLEDRLAAGGDHDWTEALLEAGSDDEETWRPRHPRLRAPDLDILAERAFSGARTWEEKRRLCTTASRRSLFSAVPGLLKLTAEEDVETRDAAARELYNLCLADWGESRAAAIPLWRALLRDPEPRVRSTAAGALGWFGAREAIPELLELLKDPDARLGAMRALGELGLREAIPRIVPFLEDRDGWVRWGAARTLSKLGAKEGTPALLKLLEDEDSGLRGNAASLLAERGEREAIPRLRASLRSVDSYEVGWAISALGTLGDRESIPDLRALLGHADRDVRQSAVWGLKALDGREALPHVRELLRDPDPYTRRVAARVLLELGSREGIPFLLSNPDDGSFGDLNSVRRPEEWRRVNAKILEGPLEGAPRDLMERFAREAGLELDWPKEEEDPYWSSRLQRAWPGTLFRAMEYAVCRDPGEVVLESGRIRVLSRENAHRFWSAWQEAEGRK